MGEDDSLMIAYAMKSEPAKKRNNRYSIRHHK